MLLDGVFGISIYTIPSKYINMDESFWVYFGSNFFFVFSECQNTRARARHTKHVPEFHFCSLLLYHLLFCETLSYNRCTSIEHPTNFVQIFRILCFFIKIGAAREALADVLDWPEPFAHVQSADGWWWWCNFCVLLFAANEHDHIALQSMLRCIFFPAGNG